MVMKSRIPVVCTLLIVIGLLCAGALGGCRDNKVQIAFDRQPKVEMEVVRAGAGAPIVEGKRVELHYTVKLEDGTVLIDTRANEQTHRMYVGDGTVIMGLDLGIRGMRLGEIRLLVIPPELGYGRAGYGDGVVPANAKLIMEVELAGVN